MDFVFETVQTIAQIYKMPVLAFEHGTGFRSTDSQKHGACIEHAHVHIMPTRSSVMAMLTEYDWENISQERLLTTSTDEEYILVRDISDDRWFWVLSPEPKPGSQYIRRKVFTMTAAPDKWDYAVVPNLEACAETMVDFDLERRLQ